MRLILVRHGQTNQNFKGILQGQSVQSRLSNFGKEQCEKLAKRLQNEAITVAMSSDLDRAVESAQILLQYHPDVSLQKTMQLRSQNHGKYEGGLMQAMKDDRNAAPSPYNFAAQDGESIRDVYTRVQQWFTSLYQQYPEQVLLAVTHRPVLVILNLILHHAELEQYEEFNTIQNASVTVVSQDAPDHWEIELTNDTSHLH